MTSLRALFGVLALLGGAQAATRDEWRSRSVYQLLTDRFAPPTPDAPCDPRKYCGGTWRTVIDKLDYVQGMGFDAIWISPTGVGLEGFTKWGENYHGFWSVNPFEPNPHFGTAADLRALSDALHQRGMYLMVDIAVNHLASTDTDISDAALAAKSDGKLLFKKKEEYHPRCDIQWGNEDSEETCWLASDGVALMDLKTESSQVANVLFEQLKVYAPGLIDGMRVDASKHMSKQFQHDFCASVNTFCIGEVYDKSTAVAAQYTQGQGLDSVFGFGMMYGAVGVFAQDQPMSYLEQYSEEAGTQYGDPTLIGAILDNHDLPRFNSLTNDRSKVFNAMALQFLWGGIPTMYYGLEQDISVGQHDPENRNPLWQYGNYQTSGESYQRVKRCNEIRSKMGALGGFHQVVGKAVQTSETDIAFQRGDALLVLTKRGAGQGGEWKVTNSGFTANEKLVDLLSCSRATTGGDGALTVRFDNGLPSFYVTEDVAGKTGICGALTGESSPSALTPSAGSPSTPASIPASTSKISGPSSATSSAVALPADAAESNIFVGSPSASEVSTSPPSQASTLKTVHYASSGLPQTPLTPVTPGPPTSSHYTSPGLPQSPLAPLNSESPTPRESETSSTPAVQASDLVASASQTTSTPTSPSLALPIPPTGDQAYPTLTNIAVSSEANAAQSNADAGPATLSSAPSSIQTGANGKPAPPSRPTPSQKQVATSGGSTSTSGARSRMREGWLSVSLAAVGGLVLFAALV